MEIKNILSYCTLCAHPIIRCTSCDNNCCNGGYGKIDNKQCSNYPIAHKEQDKFFESLNQMNSYKESQEHIIKGEIALAEENWLVAAIEFQRAAASQKKPIETLSIEQNLTQKVFADSVVALEKKATKIIQEFITSSESSLKEIVKSIKMTDDWSKTKEEYSQLIRMAVEGQTACMELHIESLAEITIGEIEIMLNE